MTISLDEFIAQYTGQQMLYPGKGEYLRGECVQLARLWIDEGLAAPQPQGVQGAADLWAGAFDARAWERHENTPDAVPEAGDVVIWSRQYGPFGHVAVALGGGDTNRFQAFSQNDPTGTAAAVREYTYRRVLGWFRPLPARTCAVCAHWLEMTPHASGECRAITVDSAAAGAAIDLADVANDLEGKPWLYTVTTFSCALWLARGEANG